MDCYQRAIALDKYLAIAYFQQGVSNFLIGDFEEALANFNDTLLYLRGNTTIDYEQLGLKYKLYSCEVLFNRGLCYIYLQEIESGMNDLTYAAKEKAKPDHDVIDEAIAETAEVSPSQFIILILWRILISCLGIYGILYTGGRDISPKRGQSQESQDQGVSRQGETGGCF